MFIHVNDLMNSDQDDLYIQLGLTTTKLILIRVKGGISFCMPLAEHVLFIAWAL